MQTVARFATSLGGVNVSNDLEVLDVNEQPVPGSTPPAKWWVTSTAATPST